MAATTGRKSYSIHDYPEHLNPFHEEDNHNKIRFWTIGRKLSRTNSISFSGIKDLKNSWSLRSFMRKDKKKQSQDSKLNQQVNGDISPVVYRRALQYTSTSGARSTVGSPEHADRYIYGGSITPLPRSRFQERLRSPSNYEVNSLSTTPRMARSEVSGSRLSVESTNPFDEAPIPPVRASRRKKKRAPMPPQEADTSASSINTTLNISEVEEKAPAKDPDLEEDVNLNVELKIVEDEEVKTKDKETEKPPDVVQDTIVEAAKDSTTEAVLEDKTIDTSKETTTETIQVPNMNTVTTAVLTHQDSDDVVVRSAENGLHETKLSNADSEGDILDKVSFPKVDITKYRRNSSVNEDEIRLRRGNLEDYHTLANKRSKSLTNTSDPVYVAYDINLNESRSDRDLNGNDEPQKVICKLYDGGVRKQSVDNSISSTEKEFIEIDRATRELEREISKLNSALIEDEDILGAPRLSVTDIKRRFDNNNSSPPNPIPKPRRSHYGGNSPDNAI
ncbi:uncharacterized protein LOC125225074 [Leguminivora glycinivorella]|uniref:uncharacterized protein LOC125225074 n=1 Tax=Leguminivora glycinivorella TaxID=1035111 RepID=UPI00200D2BB1|nr:uncharacterized protein LOC125225074 [Leguminivora glycinivorella]